MNGYSLFDADGKVLCSVASSCLASVTHPDAVGTYGECLDPNRFYIENGKPVAIPPKPSQHHIFDYTTKQWVDPRTPETEWPLVRAERDRRLLASDWTQLPDVPLQTKELWASYRQALRDITQQPDPFNITWPEPPSN